MRVAQNVRDAVARIVVKHNGKQIKITTSGGLAAIQANEQSDSLIQRADAALYAAKAGGRNCAYLHDGTQCRPVDGGPAALQKPATPTANLVELINAPDLASRLATHSEQGEDKEFGVYLTHEEISAELAQTCEELRRFLDERGQEAGEPVPPSPSASA